MLVLAVALMKIMEAASMSGPNKDLLGITTDDPTVVGASMVLEEDCLLVVARKTLVPMAMVVIAVVVACLGGFYVRKCKDFR
jgi:hypothetical protein